MPLMAVMFSVCLFVMLMQFLWKYVDEMVGKGVDIKLLAKLFFYAGNMLIPMCLPLAILLASMMTFGNLGERFELLAIKAAGISLAKIMKPVMIAVMFVAAANFIFQDTALPVAQAKVGTILMSLKQKSPEIDVPEQTFYKELPGYNIYVEKKTKNGRLQNVIIYSYAQGNENDATVIVADSGYLKISSDKTYNLFVLYNGESFKNLKKRTSGRKDELIPYVREKFEYKEITVNFDSNFTLIDESFMAGRDVGKNMKTLKMSVDSMSAVEDSIKNALAQNIKQQTFENIPKNSKNVIKTDSTANQENTSILSPSRPVEMRLKLLEAAKSIAARKVNGFSSRMFEQSNMKKQLRGHKIEMHRRCATAVACILFFFIGAPLGAIIGKGGLGFPTVISVFIFILYYTIDTFGFKLAKQGVWEVWQGMWLSPFVLLVIGAILTQRAINDFMIDAENIKHLIKFLKKPFAIQ
jgi:lipopolysaccharide export system permease protein